MGMGYIPGIIIDIGKYKAELLSDIFNNEEIVSLLEVSDTDIRNRIDNDEPEALVYKNIFPFLLVPEFEDTADTYIMLGVDSEEPNWRHNQAYCNYQITVWVMCHKDRMEVSKEQVNTWKELRQHLKDIGRIKTTDVEPGVSSRVDVISQLIMRMWHDESKFGFSPLELMSSKEVVLNVKFYYRELIFECKDLRRRVEDNPAGTHRGRERIRA